VSTSGSGGVVWAGTEHPLEARTVDAVNVEDDDLSPLARLRFLEVLRTRWTNPHATPVRLPADLAPLAALTRLRVLELPGWEIDDLGPLARLAALEELDVRGTRVRDLDPLSGLPRLRRLVLDRCPVRDLSPLLGMDSLEVVSVRETRVTADEAERLRQAVPGVEVLE
jgi:Leucine-rich repeat (LRR) protein